MGPVKYLLNKEDKIKIKYNVGEIKATHVTNTKDFFILGAKFDI